MWRRIGKWLAIAGVVIVCCVGIAMKMGGQWNVGIHWNNGESNGFDKGILVADDKGKGHPQGTNLTELERRRQEEQERERAAIERVLDTMTAEQKLAQCMILTNEKDITAENLQRYQPGGVIFFGVDFQGKTLEQVRTRVESLQQCMSIPLFVGVDEEGGEINRVKGLIGEEIPVFESARLLYTKGKAKIIEDTEQKTELLQRMGINLNFNPVADVVTDPDAYMYDRSAGDDPGKVADYVETVIAVMKDRTMGSCLKHFPGYGNNRNTHTTFATDHKSLVAYRKQDFLPYEAGIAAGAEMIMVSHITMECVDGNNPASLSLAVHSLLREELSFDGVILADDLNMQAILKKMSLEEATGKALAAGNDMIFSADFGASMKGATDALQKGEITEEELNAAVRRILRYKLHLRLIEME